MATSVTAKVEHNYGGMGSIPQYAVKIDGYVGLASAAVTNYTVSPFDEDMIILAAYMCVTTVDATGSAVIKIGLSTDAAGTSMDDSLFDTITTYSTLGVYEGLAVGAITGRACPIWKAAGSATASFITAEQEGSVDASSLVYNLILIVAPYAKFKAT